MESTLAWASGALCVSTPSAVNWLFDLGKSHSPSRLPFLICEKDGAGGEAPCQEESLMWGSIQDPGLKSKSKRNLKIFL